MANELACLNCGKGFIPTCHITRQKFCSSECRVRYNNAKRYYTDTPVNECPECGTPIEQSGEAGRWRRFCGKRCRSCTSKRQNGLWQIRWTCTFTQGFLCRFSEDFSEKWLFFVLGKVWNFDRRFCWLCRIRTPSTNASALAGCATFQTLKPQASLHPLQDEITAYWRCWDARKQSTRCQCSGWSFIC